MTQPVAALRAPYEGHINRHPYKTEWGVLNVHGGVRHFPGGDRDTAERACIAERGERVVFRHVFTGDWTEPAKTSSLASVEARP